MAGIGIKLLKDTDANIFESILRLTKLLNINDTYNCNKS